jgi:hypothetical protein
MTARAQEYRRLGTTDGWFAAPLHGDRNHNVASKVQFLSPPEVIW